MSSQPIYKMRMNFHASSRPTERHMSCFLHRVLLGASGDLQHLRVTTESDMSSDSARPQQISKPDRAAETPDCRYPGRPYYGRSTYRRRVSRAWYKCYPMHTPDPVMNIVPWKRKPLIPANSSQDSRILGSKVLVPIRCRISRHGCLSYRT